MTSRERYEKASQEQWESIVELVFLGAHADVPTYKRKAIKWARDNGCSQEAIANLGQSKVLSNYATHRREGYERQRVLRWRVSASLADAIQPEKTVNPDAEEPLQSRIARLTGIRTSEDFWLWMHSFFADVPDEAITHHAGEGDALKPKRPGSY